MKERAYAELKRLQAEAKLLKAQAKEREILEGMNLRLKPRTIPKEPPEPVKTQEASRPMPRLTGRPGRGHRDHPRPGRSEPELGLRASSGRRLADLDHSYMTRRERKAAARAAHRSLRGNGPTQ